MASCYNASTVSGGQNCCAGDSMSCMLLPILSNYGLCLALVVMNYVAIGKDSCL